MNEIVSRETAQLLAATGPAPEIPVGALVHIGAPPPLFCVWGRVALWAAASPDAPAHYVVHAIDGRVYHILPGWLNDASFLARRPAFRLANLSSESARA